MSSPTLPMCWPVNGPFQTACWKKSQLGGVRQFNGIFSLRPYITDLSVMSSPGIRQLPLTIFQVPDFHTVIGRRRHNPVPVEVELGHGHKVPVASIEVSKAARRLRVLHTPHRDDIL